MKTINNLNGKENILEIICSIHEFKSKSDAKRMIQQGGVQLLNKNDEWEKITNPQEVINYWKNNRWFEDDEIHGQILKIGKKRDIYLLTHPTIRQITNNFDFSDELDESFYKFNDTEFDEKFCINKTQEFCNSIENCKICYEKWLEETKNVSR